MGAFYVTSEQGERQLVACHGLLYARPVVKEPNMASVWEIQHPDNPARTIIGVGFGGVSEQWYVRETVDEVQRLMTGPAAAGGLAAVQPAGGNSYVAEVPEENVVGGMGSGLRG